MATFDECLAQLPAGERKWVEAVVAESGTTDSDWSVFAAAGKLLALAHGDTELEFSTTQDLVTELLGRYDHAVFGALLQPVEDQQRVLRRWRGNSLTCAGLGQELSRTILSDLESRSVSGG